MIFSVELHFEGSSCYLYVFNGDVDPPSQWILGRKKAGSLSEICGGWRLWVKDQVPVRNIPEIPVSVGQELLPRTSINYTIILSAATHRVITPAFFHRSPPFVKCQSLQVAWFFFLRNMNFQAPWKLRILASLVVVLWRCEFMNFCQNTPCQNNLRGWKWSDRNEPAFCRLPLS